MSSDIAKKELVGVRLSPQIIARLDERIEKYGGTRQEQITDILKNTLFQGC